MGGRRASSEAELALSMERGSLATLLSHLPDNLYPVQPVSSPSLKLKSFYICKTKIGKGRPSWTIFLNMSSGKLWFRRFFK